MKRVHAFGNCDRCGRFLQADYVCSGCDLEPEDLEDHVDSHPGQTSVSEGTVKLSTDQGEEASRQSDQGEVEGGQI